MSVFQQSKRIYNVIQYKSTSFAKSGGKRSLTSFQERTWYFAADKTAPINYGCSYVDNLCFNSTRKLSLFWGFDSAVILF